MICSILLNVFVDLWKLGIQICFYPVLCGHVAKWIGAPDLVDLDLLESGQPMNVLMYRKGVGCSD